MSASDTPLAILLAIGWVAVPTWCLALLINMLMERFAPSRNLPWTPAWSPWQICALQNVGWGITTPTSIGEPGEAP